MLRPLTAVDLAGETPTHVGESLYRTTCPACGDALWTDRHSLVCANATCTPGAFSPLSYLATKWYLDIPAARARANDLMRHDVVSELDAHVAARDHQTLVAWARMRPDDKSDAPAVCDGVMRLRKALVLELLASMQILEFPIALQESSHVSLLQTTPHNAVGLQLRNGRRSQVYFCTPTRHSFIGLRRVVPGRAVTIGRDAIVRPHERSTAPAIDQPWRPGGSAPVIVVRDAQELVVMSRVMKSFSALAERALGVTAAGYQTSRAVDTSWVDFSCSAFYSLTGKGAELPLSAARSIQSAALPAVVLRRLANRAKMSHRPFVAQELLRLHENRILYQDARVTVKETAHAYVSETRAGVADITNFTLRPARTVVFRDLGEVRYEVRARYGDKDQLVLLTDECWDYPQKLQDALRLQMLQDAGPMPRAVPAILDMHATKKWVLPELRRDSGKLPSVDGLAYLGWAPDRDVFQVPGCRFTLEGKEEGRFPLHPASAILRSYSSARTDWGQAMPANLPDAVLEIIGQVVANMVRQFLRTPPTTIPVRHSPTARAWTSQMFRGLGQTAIFEFSSNVRDAAPNQHLRGMPLLATGLNKHQIEQLRSCCVCLADAGAELPDYETPDDLQSAARALQFALAQVAEWCLATQAEAFKSAMSVNPLRALAEEGQTLLRDVCGVQTKLAERNAHEQLLEALLNQIPRQDTEVRMQVRSDRLRLNLRGLRVPDTEGLREALVAHYANADVQPHYIEVSAADMVPALAAFYGAVPELTYETS